MIQEEFPLTENVIIKKIGGHSIGSCVVLAGRYVLCGDECYHEKCLTEKIPTGVSCNEEKSLNFVAEYGSGKYIPLLFHDPGILPGKVGAVNIS